MAYRVMSLKTLHASAPQPGGLAEEWMESALNYAEEQGWELVTVQGGDTQPPYFIFKHNGTL